MVQETTCYQEGSLGSKICFVGEAPGRNEIKENRPFVGMAGQLFNDLLREAGIARQECFITNTFEEQVFKSRDERLWFDQEGNTLFIVGKGFTERGKEASKGALQRIAECRANVTVPMGSAALCLLYGDTRISKWRGSIIESQAIPGYKLVPTFHPSFIQHGNYIHRYTVASDLRRIIEESGRRAIKRPERHLHIDPIFPDVIAFLGEATKCKRVATDIEVLNHNVSCFSIAISPAEAMSIPLIDKRGEHRWNEEQEASIWTWYSHVLGNSSIMKINQNIIFDISFLLQKNNIFTYGPLGDTMIAHHILYPDFPKGLDFICSTYTREPYYKDDGKLWSKPWVDMERFWRYNALDSVVAFEAWLELEKELEEKEYKWTYDKTLGIFQPLMYMMVHGIRLNTTRLAEQKAEARSHLSDLEAKLKSVAEWDFNPGSPKQCQEYFYVTKGIKPYVSTKTGTITTDDKAMARIWKRYNLPEAKLVQEIRAIRKLISSYLEVQFDPDERIRCFYNPRGTTTGRISSSETVFGTGMNLANLTTEFKDFLEADE